MAAKTEAKPKQKRLPGMVPKKIAELEDAAEKVRDLQTERMQLQEQEEEARDKLLEIMKQHKLKVYPLDEEYVAEIKDAGEKAYVHRKRGRPKKKDGDEKEDGEK